MEETPKKKRMGLITWIKTYGYYYKGAAAVALIGAVFVLAIIFLMRYEGADFKLFVVTGTEIDTEAYCAFLENVNEYVYEVDGDNSEIMRNYRYALDGTTSTEDLSKLAQRASEDDCIAFVVDEAGYEYVKNLCSLRELSFFEIQSDDDDPYRMTLNDTALMQDTGMDGDTTYYLVMKYYDNSEYQSAYLSGRTDIVVGMARNNDRNEENDVAIQS